LSIIFVVQDFVANFKEGICITPFQVGGLLFELDKIYHKILITPGGTI
jgi:hypothetical protein